MILVTSGTHNWSQMGIGQQRVLLCWEDVGTFGAGYI